MIDSIIAQAQTELISPKKFYHLCQQFFQKTGQTRLYFGEPIASCLAPQQGLGVEEIRTFLNSLVTYVKLTATSNTIAYFYLNFCDKSPQYPITITVKIIGCGMVGRVAKITINGSKPVAFKTFFDPDFVWTHGPWGEIPVGIHLKYYRVTKNMAEFLFASQDWAVWEWIDPENTKLNQRQGLTYQEFAQKEGLTKLNPLNLNNYNSHGIRLDPGGIQKEYDGRRLFDIYRGTLFYFRKIRRDGWNAIAKIINSSFLAHRIKGFF